ncbi:Biotinyl protein ligase (BPL) and lipoyl protein ligase (LPL) [Trypanosoma melophagium]|uniref:Biotinyl protein ligase (BPL) and lipoyl protein ligase (LPL) n=1 Tax=Trypanosoma melophagium TaxID=715481 RepID=UPI00351A948C|nr:Biotinyl protein ligase (BPL) and lipoyl protein ligase (LPL) [Trypanosoma melophagium]
MTESVPPNIHYMEEVSSTMDVAREMLAAAKTTPFAVLAESQTKGRGTGGRTWVSPKGNMYLTICVPERMIPAEVIPVLPLLAGLVCRAAVMELLRGSADVHLKWPNDIIHNGKKIGGTLVETDGAHLILGIGMNVAMAPPLTDAGRPATTVRAIAAAAGVDGENIHPRQLAQLVWRHLFATVKDNTITRNEIVRRFDTAMDKSLTLHRRNGAEREAEPLTAVRLNEWGHLTVRAPDGREETLVAEYLF